jgi:heat shock protein HtpX
MQSPARIPAGRPLGLTLRMLIVTGLLFVITWAAFSALADVLVRDEMSFIILSIVMSAVFVGLQYLAGPRLISWSMNVRWVTPQEAPDLHRQVGELAAAADIPMPRVGIADIAIPNTFAFGRWKSDGRVDRRKSAEGPRRLAQIIVLGQP